MRKLLFTTLLLLALPLTVIAQSDADAAPISPELALHLDGIEQIVIDLRGLQPTAAVTRGFPSREEVSEFLMTSITEQLSEDIVREADAFYVAFDFIEPGTDIVGVYIGLLQDQVAGYYDTETQVMNTILMSGAELGDSLPLLEQTIYAHEYTHALQDQIFDLESLGFDPDADMSDVNTDAFLAVQSLIEGDATITMSLFVEEAITRNPRLALGALSLLADPSLTAMPEGTPPILMSELEFPYFAGASFVSTLIEQGGWARVDEAFTNLPASSEHIIHPETYLNGDMPQIVTVATSPLDADWTAVTDGVFGEFYLREYLRLHLDRATADDAAAGWGGDTYQVYESGTGDLAFTLRVAWDAPEEAAAFLAAFNTYGDTRNGDTRDGECWVGADALCAAKTPNGDTVITNGPTLAVATALLSAETR
ncbi:MAG: hypothetical protein AAF125_19465 [Chloroflexota bacterium]